MDEEIRLKMMAFGSAAKAEENVLQADPGMRYKYVVMIEYKEDSDRIQGKEEIFQVFARDLSLTRKDSTPLEFTNILTNNHHEISASQLFSICGPVPLREIFEKFDDDSS